MLSVLRCALILSLLTNTTAAHALTAHALGAVGGDKKVYVCISRASVAYHTSPTCEGLGHCTHIVRSVSPDVARKLGKRTCFKCYPGVAARTALRPVASDGK